MFYKFFNNDGGSFVLSFSFSFSLSGGKKKKMYWLTLRNVQLTNRNTVPKVSACIKKVIKCYFQF